MVRDRKEYLWIWDYFTVPSSDASANGISKLWLGIWDSLLQCQPIAHGTSYTPAELPDSINLCRLMISLTRFVKEACNIQLMKSPWNKPEDFLCIPLILNLKTEWQIMNLVPYSRDMLILNGVCAAMYVFIPVPKNAFNWLSFAIMVPQGNQPTAELIGLIRLYVHARIA